ncbi:undecaprenyl/decaprenyl-phosphate alpha-N-acetylglucosaminyl 1-phosphate transferase [Tenacibaculum aiptasiae]|uniref:Undecaprenyl/decaprenyl-phosphate alpha-N-acetylglucosaminyl 1-phosphate transferase n=1 Tax=Tenacibaculum aiptasiae TaxID=426481 RepID=A0A7J5A6Y1_9FLAO|nr:MraY family glycosyltransferase [Tenacibaculum aiptasiae]KAB1153288.1 undecaprenyl/decaprenyl-phosphate alpha-N-acetylglucosaminyl 1-phosphate transferase [Tenacibaculum aiptasiae]
MQLVMFLITLGLFLIGSFLVTYFVIPKIIKVVSYKKLLDEPNNRSSHKKVTPTLGGVAFYITIILSFFFLKKWDSDLFSLNLMVSITVLFIIGLKDDLIAISAKTKALAQILAISFLVFDNGLMTDTLGGFLGITNVNYWTYLVFVYFAIFFIINSYNLIDGIDGLASSVGIMIFTLYSIIFYLLGENYYFFLCIVIIGTLLAFLSFNLSEKRKIFMGDTGSMIIGFLIALLTFKILTYNYKIDKIDIPSENLIIILTSIISIPVLDTVRVFIIRTINKKSFFIADRNHVHHVFVDQGLSHRRATFFIVFINLIITTIIYLLSSVLNSFALLFVFLLLSVVFYMVLFYFNMKKNENQELRPNFLNKIAKTILNFFL